MPIETFQLYTAGALNITGSTITLSGSYDDTTDVLLEIDDDDSVLEGDRFNNEDGNDSNQYGTLTDLSGTYISGGSSTSSSPTTVYSEFQYELSGSDGSTITLYYMEMDSDPNSNSGTGIFIGYLPSSPLVPGVTYTYSTANTVSGNSPEYEDIEGAICFTSNSYIKTDEAIVQICDLEPGMRIKTRDNGFQKLLWVYKRTISQYEMSENPSLKPVKITANAFGQGMPCRDMHLSQQHRVLHSDLGNEILFTESHLLVPAKGLINDTTITIDNEMSTVEYVHLLFDAHQIVYVDGIEAESFALGKWSYDSLTEEAREEINAIFPELSPDGMAQFKTAYPTLTVNETFALPRASA
ncbi:Hint domain-containing protein [Sulfitobacter marinus]|uniref:Hint domain-containing protein n=1 Tax=Sulfitobacter marinus TaxID=394264 RepID=A0A1I6RV63_9RHOB|nr:Hint domain-containing protein [Sulfitobacter marinus]SFS68556.1 Hint domain-containing protein [Sulfitobacter marinus]